MSGLEIALITGLLIVQSTLSYAGRKYKISQPIPRPIDKIDSNQCGHCTRKEHSMICNKCKKYTCSDCIDENLDLCNKCSNSTSKNLRQFHRLFS